jgi:hypothetical protein
MAKDKKITLGIPAEFNSKLNLYLLKIRDIGVDITKAQLLIRLADVGLKFEEHEIEITKQ